MTTWTNDTFTHGPWTVTRYPDRVDVTHTDRDIHVDVDADNIEVFGEGGRAWGAYAIRVYIPLPVVRAILEAQDAIKEQG